MRNSLVAGATAGVLVLASLQAPVATAQSSERQYVTQSSASDSVKPVELLKKEVGGYVQMSSGLVNADAGEFAAGFRQAASVLVPVFLGTIAIGSVVELVMRGLRMANQR
ncbi:hypothetical protein [uncultured Corynebacterium sp.]|uniref:hypothetical protein n=1 Tax=uncultured Corynebacterium sp. TaxID=159447 RepID=UPI00259B159C|nr:hypothetical protein [uncultured Corynebacterium sp.]